VPSRLTAALLHAGLRRSVRIFQARDPRYGRARPLRRHPRELRLRAGDLHLHCLEWPGADPPLVLLHGLNNSAWIWARVADRLADEGRRVISVTLRGHGASSKPGGDYSLPATTGDLAALLGTLGVHRVALAGHSWGGKVALHFATQHPHRLDCLVLADPAPPRGLSPPLSHGGLVGAAFRPERRSYPDRHSWREAMSSLIQHQLGDDTDRLAWSAVYREQPDGSLQAALPGSAFQAILRGPIQQDLRPRLPAIRCPTQLLLPSISLSPIPGTWREAQRVLPLLDRRDLVGDHTFIHTNSEATCEAMASFLATHAPSRDP